MLHTVLIFQLEKIQQVADIFQKKVPAAIYIANGFGKLMGISQVEELGNIETPIILTNTLSVPTAADALIDYTIFIKKNNEKCKFGLPSE